VAVVPLNFTAVAPVKLVPVIVTSVPNPPLVGLNPVMTGVTRNDVVLDLGPPGALTVINPVVAPAGTFTVIEVFDQIVGTLVTPLNATVLAP
jgi:hypothetical protein